MNVNVCFEGFLLRLQEEKSRAGDMKIVEHHGRFFSVSDAAGSPLCIFIDREGVIDVIWAEADTLRWVYGDSGAEKKDGAKGGGDLS